MNNEEKILAMLEKQSVVLEKMETRQSKTEALLEKHSALLETLASDVANLKQGQAKLEHGQAKLEHGQAKLEQGQARLEIELTDVKSTVNRVHERVALMENENKLNFGGLHDGYKMVYDILEQEIRPDISAIKTRDEISNLRIIRLESDRKTI